MKTTLTRIFIALESESHGLSENRKLRRNFSESSEIQTFFQPKKRWSPKKKKRSSPKLRQIFRPKSEIQTFFQPKNRWSPKKKVFKPKLRQISRKFKRFFSPKTGGFLKKKKKKVFTQIETDFTEIQTFLQPKNSWSPKKKRSSPKLKQIFRPKSEILTLFQAESRHVLHNFGTQFRLGGLFSLFSPKIGLKSTKKVQFCILHKPMEEGSSPPPLATLLQPMQFKTMA